MKLLPAIAAVANGFWALFGLVPLVISSSVHEYSPGSIAVFSDSSCTDTVVSLSGSVALDACVPASTTGNLSITFIIGEKPYCQDGNRPDLVLFEDACCAGYAIAHYIPNANYGDYGNGSCQHLIGGGFRAFVFVCGEFQIPTPSSIMASFTFPSSPSQSLTTIPQECLAAITSTTGAVTTQLPQTTKDPSSASTKTSGSSYTRAAPPGVIIGVITFAALFVAKAPRGWIVACGICTFLL